MKKWILRIVASLAALAAAASLLVYWEIHRQGVSATEWSAFSGAKVRFDDHGIPTIESDTWLKVIEAQGYVVASERLFQMDLIRRSAKGRLSEWFGEAALPADERRALEDWDGAAERAYQALPPGERTYVDAYAEGVNRFIRDHAGRWGVEYLILGTGPEPWTGSDSLSVLLSMADQLTAFSSAEAQGELFAKKLDPDWAAFLFPRDHPWNVPMFGESPHHGPVLPVDKALPQKPIAPAELAPLHARRETEPRGASPEVGSGPGRMYGGAQDVRREPPLDGIGSNNWAWCGKTGCFLANDPHLGATVPHIWFAARLRVAADDWVVGVSIPGLPGIILGMNPHLAWAFTNVGEDVDDFLIEKLDDGEKNYLAAIEDGREIWKPIIRIEKTIKIKGGGTKSITALFTHRGPLAKRPSVGGQWCSRQWLPLKEGVLRFPAQLSRAKTWEEMNAALDQMRVPAQNVLVVDRKRDVGYRASGTGIIRKIDGNKPQPALEGEWGGYLPPESRPRVLLPPAGEAPRFLATANERIWVDAWGHRWTEDLRKERIRRFLASKDSLTHADMQRLQLDTESRYARLFLDWTKDHASPQGQEAKDVIARWSRWNGVAKDDPQTFTDAMELDRTLSQLAIGRVKDKFFGPADEKIDYAYPLRSAWVIAMLEAKDGARVFGFEDRDLADHLLAVAVERAKDKAPPYTSKNRWAAQHPFAGRVPVLGGLFAVDTPIQYGWRGVVRVEQPSFGASVRMVWDVGDPMESTWSLPVGQSGHIGSPHYRDLQKDWFEEKAYKVFDPAFEWRTE